MSDELTLKVGRRGAELLYRQLLARRLVVYSDDRRYIDAILLRLEDYLTKPLPIHVNMKIISVNGIPAEEYYRAKGKEDGS